MLLSLPHLPGVNGALLPLTLCDPLSATLKPLETYALTLLF